MASSSSPVVARPQWTREVQKFALEWPIPDSDRDHVSAPFAVEVFSQTLQLTFHFARKQSYNFVNVALEGVPPAKDVLAMGGVAVCREVTGAVLGGVDHANFVPVEELFRDKAMVKFNHLPAGTRAKAKVHIMFARDVGPKGQPGGLVRHLRAEASAALADVTLACSDGKALPAFRLVLSARSAVFRAMFASGMEEARTGRVVLDDMTSEVAEAFLDFLIADEADWDKGVDAGQLLAAANKFDVAELKEICSQRVAADCKVENCVDNLILGHLHDDAKVLSAAVKILSKNKQAITASEEWSAMKKDHPKIFESICSSLLSLV
jgi:hypothetical protein